MTGYLLFCSFFSHFFDGPFTSENEKLYEYVLHLIFKKVKCWNMNVSNQELIFLIILTTHG